MEFETVLGYRVKGEKIKEQAKRHKVNIEETSYLRAIRNLIKRSGCPIIDLRRIRQEDRTRDDDDTWILTLYEGYKDKEDINIEKITSKFPLIFETIKKDLGINEDPEFFLAEP